MMIESIHKIVTPFLSMLNGKASFSGDSELTDAFNSLPQTDEELERIDFDNDSRFSGLKLRIERPAFLKIKGLQKAHIDAKRIAAYREEADPLFFEAEADGGSKEAWLAKREEIKRRFPYPSDFK